MASVESGTDIIVLKRVVVSFSSPRIKTVIFHLAIGNGGIQTSYMVFQNVAHGGGVVINHKDSE
jgi:heterodisulfide reductase subunit A-like polyferredoxin